MLREGQSVVFGRESSCTVVLDDHRVSRRHAALNLRHGAIELTDFGSRNGTTVDGGRVAAHAIVSVLAASVVRIGEAVVVFEVEHMATVEQCFDRATLEEKGNALLATARANKTRVGLIDLRWEHDDASNSKATAQATSSGIAVVPLRQLIARVAGPGGVVSHHETAGIILLCPSIDAAKLDATAALVRQLCAERKIPVVVKVALSGEARSVQELLLQSSQGTGVMPPPVMFQGGLYSLEKLVSRLDSSDASVLILGETGVGKDVLARSLHVRSRRAARPYVALNSAAFSETLFESELFGYERGAFTGAVQAKTGLLESAAGGTVFLDEIGEMPLSLQAKLLRVVENREILRVGGLTPRPIDVRFIFATNRDLRAEIEAKRFRSDLYFRVSTVSLKVPPLRERAEEIVPLAVHFIELAARRLGRPVPALLAPSKHFLRGHSWPGNVRELKNIIELAVLVYEDHAIRPSDLHIDPYIPVPVGTSDGEPTPSSGLASPTTVDAPPAPSYPPTSVAWDRAQPFPAGPALIHQPLRRIDRETERALIQSTLEQTRGNQSEAARLLGMPRRTLVKRLAEYRKRDP